MHIREVKARSPLLTALESLATSWFFPFQHARTEFSVRFVSNLERISMVGFR